MTATNFINLHAELEIVSNHSRSRVGNDSAFSEAHFTTLKTQPDHPAHFTGAPDARIGCGDFIDWHNGGHRHSGLNGCNDPVISCSGVTLLKDTP